MKKLFTAFLSVLIALTMLMPAFAVPNPIVEVTDDDAFEEQLGIEFDADDITARPKTLSIIDGKLGQVSFDLENVDGEKVDWYIRFSKDAELTASVEVFSGIYDEQMTEPFTVSATVQDDDDDDQPVTVELACVYAQTVNATIYTWEFGGARFCLVAAGTVSQMQLAAVLDEALEASVDD